MSYIDGYVRNEEEIRKDSNPVATVGTVSAGSDHDPAPGEPTGAPVE